MADKEYEINLVKVIKENFSAIQNDTYDWKQEEVEAVYKLANAMIQKVNIKFGEYTQDVCEEIVMHFFNYIVKKVDITRENGILWYIGEGLKNSILMCYRKNKKYLDKVSLELDNEVDGKDGTSISKLQLIESNDKPFEEKIHGNYKSAYEHDLFDIAKDFQMLKLYYIDRMSQSNIALKLNITQTYIPRKIKLEKDTLKILLMERGHTIDLINNKIQVSNTYKYIEKLISKNGLLSTIYSKGNDPIDIAEGLDIDVKSVNEAIKYLINKKVELLANKGIENAKVYLAFTKEYFPSFLHKIETLNDEYFKFVDLILDSNNMLSLKFRDNLKINDIAKKLNMSNSFICKKVKSIKKTVNELYKEYVENNYDLNLVDINSRKPHKSKKELNTYENFTKYNLPELLDKEESKNKKYYDFVSKILESDKILFKWYKENKTSVEIAKELGITQSMVEKKIYRSKPKIVSMYNMLLENDYDLSRLVINHDKYIETLLKRGIENPKMYIKFINYYLPELLDTVDKQDDKFFKMIDWIISKDCIMEKYFMEDKKQTEIAIELNTKGHNINKKLKYNSNKINQMYNDFLTCLKIDEKNAHCYIPFTKYYFPELLENLEKKDKAHFDFIDYVVHQNQMLYKFFYEHKSLKELSEELNLKYESLLIKMHKSKAKMRALYEEYLKKLNNIKRM